MVGRRLLLFVATCSVTIGAPAFAQESDEEELAEITVRAARVANLRPAGTYASVATMLRFDPVTELQSRGLPEGQADVTVRGGLFENTGFRAGAVTIIDPQTGHYAAELPIDPEFLTAPEVRTGIANSVAGFNSNIATVTYAPRRISGGGSVLIGAGSDSLNFQSLRFASTEESNAGAGLGAALSLARSEGDGTVDNGDHEFQRYNLHLQRSLPGRQTDLILSYQDKFYGWPGAYTGFATLAETDDTNTTLLFLNHRVEVSNGWWDIGVFHRRLEDDYDFDRTTQESGVPGSFDHETRVFGVGFDGLYRRGIVDWRFAGQVTADELVSSTDLTEGNFDSRNYVTLTVAPVIEFSHGQGRTISLEFGATLDKSNRDESAVSPLIGATYRKATVTGEQFIALEYAGSTQLPGYTVLNSRPMGLFGGNPDLGREKARQLSLTAGKEAGDWDGKVTLFLREDDDLVDWTFASGAPFARQANPVDIDVFGVELFLRRQWESLDLVGSYTYIDKDADYGSAIVDASFYALNFARHRATLAARWRIGERFELRWDNEYREQEENALRSSSASALLVSLAFGWEPPGGKGFGLTVTADNLTDEDFEPFPGTPAIGRQISLSAKYLW